MRLMTRQRLQLTWYNKDKALIPTETGRYGYSWVDPSDPRYCETHALVDDAHVVGTQSPKSGEFSYSDQADLSPQDDNLLINGESGDVLEALTRVPELAARYAGRVKLVYIDPPFNTSQTFASYEDNLEHSIWLTMMRDRLLNLKKLLSQDGSIWVHLDDVENHRMRLLMDEVFGSSNFVAEVAWEKTFKPRNDAKMVSGRHDTLVVYQSSNQLRLNKLPRTAAMDGAYANPDGDHRGPWTSAPATAPGARTHQGMVFGLQHPITGEVLYPPIGQCWRFGQERFMEIMKGWNEDYELAELGDEDIRAQICNVATEDVRQSVPALIIAGFSPDQAESIYKRGRWPLVYMTRHGRGGLRRKTYLSDMDERAIEDLWFQNEVGSNDEAKDEVKRLFAGETPFSTPKPERLLKRIIHVGTNPGDIVLDCFAGSGTTAAVAQKMGRRWVTCELLKSTFDTFTLPRLEKVVNNEDAGGITRTKGERVAAEDVDLPDGVSPDDAAKFTSVLNKLITDDDELKKNKVIKGLKKLAKTTRTKEVINWRGGGGFTVAHLSPACFDYSPVLDRVVLTPDATGETLVKSVAANLGFALLSQEESSTFDGRRGKTLLKVYEGIADPDLVDVLLARLHDGETLVLATTGVMDGTREHLRKALHGSRVVLIPDDIFSYTEEDER
jgi:adenine-specific DNA-methyltransferase